MKRKFILLALLALVLLAGCELPDINAVLLRLSEGPSSPLFYGPLSIFMWGLLLVIYFMPTIIAIATRKSRIVTVLMINAFLGWTIVGWIIALILARM